MTPPFPLSGQKHWLPQPGLPERGWILAALEARLAPFLRSRLSPSMPRQADFHSQEEPDSQIDISVARPSAWFHISITVSLSQPAALPTLPSSLTVTFTYHTQVLRQRSLRPWHQGLISEDSFPQTRRKEWFWDDSSA